MSVIVYTKDNCMKCKMVKNQLKANDIPFEEINFEKQPEIADSLREEGFTAAPVVKYGDFSFCDFDVRKIKELISMVKNK